VRIGKGYLYEYYKKQMYKKGKNVAKTALARKISRMVYHLLKQHITYDTFVERNVNKMRRVNKTQVQVRFILTYNIYKRR